mmetsp:Transcript_2888/g.8103  ORF Transcript_2888/g.8103 Transcript_2888/m.8103 type:complete len:91 (-) Transcript_2888:100-372(-)
MEGFDARRAKEVLRIPDRYAVAMMVAAGYEYEDPSTFMKTPRLPVDEIVFKDTFGNVLQPDDGGVGDRDGSDDGDDEDDDIAAVGTVAQH